MKCNRFTPCPNMFHLQNTVPSAAAWWQVSVFWVVTWLRGGFLGGCCCLSALSPAPGVLLSVGCGAKAGRAGRALCRGGSLFGHLLISRGAQMARPTESLSGRSSCVSGSLRRAWMSGRLQVRDSNTKLLSSGAREAMWVTC